MPSDPLHTVARRTHPTARSIASGCILLFLGGCADLSFDNVRLGQEEREYRRAFPDERSRRTPTGICYLEASWNRTDAVAVLLTRDRRIAAKLQATLVERKYGFGVESGYRLRGDLDPVLLDLAGTGPVDLLRAVADQLTEPQPDAFALEAQSWVAAGLVRFIQRWPQSTATPIDPGPAETRIGGTLERVPADGQARLAINPAGILHVEYTQGAAP